MYVARASRTIARHWGVWEEPAIQVRCGRKPLPPLTPLSQTPTPPPIPQICGDDEDHDGSKRMINLPKSATCFDSDIAIVVAQQVDEFLDNAFT